MTCAVLALPGIAAALSPGDLDPSFGGDGVSVYPLSAVGGESQIDALGLQPDGKILLGGFGTDSNGHDAFLVARLDRNGLLDASFGDAGRVLVQLGGSSSPSGVSSEADALALQPDGKILAGGFASSGNAGFILTRLTADGRFDSTFGTAGKARAGRVRHRKLAPGRYRLQAVPHFAGKNGRAKTTGFRITR